MTHSRGESGCLCLLYKGFKDSFGRNWKMGPKGVQASNRSQLVDNRTYYQNSSQFESLKPHNARLLKASVISFEGLEEAMTTWVLQMEHQKKCLSDALIQKQPLRLAKMMNIIRTYPKTNLKHQRDSCMDSKNDTDLNNFEFIERAVMHK